MLDQRIAFDCNPDSLVYAAMIDSKQTGRCGTHLGEARVLLRARREALGRDDQQVGERAQALKRLGDGGHVKVADDLLVLLAVAQQEERARATHCEKQRGAPE